MVIGVGAIIVAASAVLASSDVMTLASSFCFTERRKKIICGYLLFDSEQKNPLMKNQIGKKNARSSRRPDFIQRNSLLIEK